MVAVTFVLNTPPPAILIVSMVARVAIGTMNTSVLSAVFPRHWRTVCGTRAFVRSAGAIARSVITGIADTQLSAVLVTFGSSRGSSMFGTRTDVRDTYTVYLVLAEGACCAQIIGTVSELESAQLVWNICLEERAGGAHRIVIRTCAAVPDSFTNEGTVFVDDKPVRLLPTMNI